MKEKIIKKKSVANSSTSLPDVDKSQAEEGKSEYESNNNTFLQEDNSVLNGDDLSRN